VNTQKLQNILKIGHVFTNWVCVMIPIINVLIVNQVRCNFFFGPCANSWSSKFILLSNEQSNFDLIVNAGQINWRWSLLTIYFHVFFLAIVKLLEIVISMGLDVMFNLLCRRTTCFSFVFSLYDLFVIETSISYFW